MISKEKDKPVKQIVSFFTPLVFTQDSPARYNNNNYGDNPMADKLTSRQRFVLAAMAAEPRISYAPVQVQKYFFILDKNITKEISGPHFKFVPHNFGPFDSAVYFELEKLSQIGLVRITNQFGPSFSRRYELTPAGEDIGRKEMAKLGPKAREYMSEIANWIKGLSFEKLVSAIYKSYPDMRKNSIFED